MEAKQLKRETEAEIEKEQMAAELQGQLQKLYGKIEVYKEQEKKRREALKKKA